MNMREIINLMENEHDPMAFADHLIDACSNAGVGFYFEEGGCWGMALALYEVANQRGLSPEILVSDKLLHAMVRIGSTIYDHQGAIRFSGKAQVMTPEQMLGAAEQAGVTAEEVEADKQEALEIIQNAIERASHPA